MRQYIGVAVHTLKPGRISRQWAGGKVHGLDIGSHVVFKLWRFKITRKNLPICKKIYKKIKDFLFNY